MAQFLYKGNHPETETLGFRFRVGEPTEVTDERVIQKLRNNSHFSEVFEGVEVLMPETKPKRESLDAEVLEDVNSFDRAPFVSGPAPAKRKYTRKAK